MIIDFKKYGGPCACGKNHAIQTETAIIQSGCLKNFELYKARFFNDAKHITAVYDENTYLATSSCRPNTDFTVILPAENLHADEKGCEKLLQKLPKQTDLLLAIGAGTVHDITRYCAYQNKIPFVSCPTAASVDGFCSSVAAMTWNGYKKTFTAVAPKLVLADTDIISQAPMRLTRSGFGDMIGKFIALTDWKIANAITGEYLCQDIYNLMLRATETVLESVNSLMDNDEKAYEQLIYGLLTSGIAMQMIGNSRPASGAEHHISHFIEMQPTALPCQSTALHGEKVGVATLLVAEEYHKLIDTKIEWKDYISASEQTVYSIFGEKLSSSILQENEKDCALEITAEKLRAVENQIREIISIIPTKEKLLEKYLLIGANKTLEDIGVDESYKDLFFKYSPLVRNRLTFMRLRKTI